VHLGFDWNPKSEKRAAGALNARVASKQCNKRALVLIGFGFLRIHV
jgi:hypothetical protein